MSIFIGSDQCKETGKTSSCIYWLYQAKQFNPSHAFFAKPENVAAILNGIKSADLQCLFKEGDCANWLLDCVALCPTFKCLTFDVFFNSEYVNNTLVNFLTKSNYLSELKMCSVWSANASSKMTAQHAKILAHGLRLNRSVESLNLSDQSIRDEGLIAIIDALVINAQIKLQKLNLYSCGITDRGATYLLENLNKIPSLYNINLDNNKACNNAIITAIYELLAARRSPEVNLSIEANASESSNVVTVKMSANQVSHVAEIDVATCDQNVVPKSTSQCRLM